MLTAGLELIFREVLNELTDVSVLEIKQNKQKENGKVREIHLSKKINSAYNPHFSLIANL